METLNFVQCDRYSTIVIPNFDSEDTLYTIESHLHPQSLRSSSITRKSDDSEKGDIELASVSYVDYSDTRVQFGKNIFDLNAVMRRRNIYSNSRIFVAPDGQTYKWSVHGKKLELRHADTRILIARSHPKHSPTIFNSKGRPASLEVLHDIVLAADPKMLDAIIITYSIMQHKLDERTQYRGPYAS